MGNAKINFKTKQTANGETDESELFTLGEYRIHKGDYFIDYDETETTGYNGCHVQLHLSGNTLTMTRTGNAFSSLVFEKGERHFCHYGTEYGGCMVGITTTQLNVKLGENGGEIAVTYSIDVNAGLVTTNELRLTVELLREKDENEK